MGSACLLYTSYLPTDKKVVRFGPGAELEITDLVERKNSLTFKANFLGQALDLPVTGKYNATNAMIAAYVAIQEGVSEEQLRQAFQNLELTRNRTEWKKACLLYTSKRCIRLCMDSLPEKVASFLTQCRMNNTSMIT